MFARALPPLVHTLIFQRNEKCVISIHNNFCLYIKRYIKFQLAARSLSVSRLPGRVRTHKRRHTQGHIHFLRENRRAKAREMCVRRAPRALCRFVRPSGRANRRRNRGKRSRKSARALARTHFFDGACSSVL